MLKGSLLGDRGRRRSGLAPSGWELPILLPTRRLCLEGPAGQNVASQGQGRCQGQSPMENAVKQRFQEMPAVGALCRS